MKQVTMAILVLFIFGGAPAVYAGGITGMVAAPGKSNLENIVVYVEGVPGSFLPPKKEPEMNHINLRFQPGVLAVMKGTTVSFPNADTVFHSAFSISKTNPFELGLYGPGREKSWRFQNLGLAEVFCHIHSHMFGFVLVLDNPFFASTSKDGSFTISDIPDGTYKVKAWMSPSVNDTKSITVKGGEMVAVNFLLKSDK